MEGLKVSLGLRGFNSDRENRCARQLWHRPLGGAEWWIGRWNSREGGLNDALMTGSSSLSDSGTGRTSRETIPRSAEWPLGMAQWGAEADERGTGVRGNKMSYSFQRFPDGKPFLPFSPRQMDAEEISHLIDRGKLWPRGFCFRFRTPVFHSEDRSLQATRYMPLSHSRWPMVKSQDK